MAIRQGESTFSALLNSLRVFFFTYVARPCKQRVANFGPQAKFPVPEGVLNHKGTNTVALALWQLTPTAVSPTLEVVLDDAVQGGVGPVAVNNPGWTPRDVV